MKTSAIFVALFAIFAFTSVKAQDCATCELVINFIEGYVENNSTESQILQVLDSVCSLFPSYATTCDAIADQGLAQIIAWIQQNESPQTICTQLGLCTSSKTETVVNSLPKFSDIKNSHIPSKISFVKTHTTHVEQAQCGSCEEVVSIIEEWLDQTDNQDEVISAIEIVCTYMPDWESTCDAMIAAEIPNVVAWIDKYENSTVVCNQLGMC